MLHVRAGQVIKTVPGQPTRCTPPRPARTGPGCPHTTYSGPSSLPATSVIGEGCQVGRMKEGDAPPLPGPAPPGVGQPPADPCFRGQLCIPGHSLLPEPGRQPCKRRITGHGCSYYGAVPTSIEYPRITLYEAVAATAHRLPEAIAWEFFGTTATYRELLASIDACANALAALGLQAGDRLLISMPTAPAGVIAVYAANKLGVVPALIHPLSHRARDRAVPERHRITGRAHTRRVLRRVRTSSTPAAASAHRAGPDQRLFVTGQTPRLLADQGTQDRAGARRRRGWPGGRT